MEGKAEHRHPGERETTNNIMKFLVPMARGCLAYFYNNQVVNVFSFVAHRGFLCSDQLLFLWSTKQPHSISKWALAYLYLHIM